jgi:Trk K+ transport system NAD-binding subunit
MRAETLIRLVQRAAHLAVMATASVLLIAAIQPLSAQNSPEQATLIVLMGVDTFAVEVFTRYPDRMEGEISGRMIGRVTYVARLQADATVSALELSAWRPGASPDEPPGQTASFTMRGDSVRADLTMGETSTQPTFATRAGAVPYLNPSMALMEQVVRRAGAMDADSVDVPLFMTAGAQTFTATVTRTADTAIIAIPGSTARFNVDGEGRLLGGVIPSQNIRVVRVEGAMATSLGSTPPDYSAPPGAPYTAQEVRVTTRGGHVLAGTLTRPLGPGRAPAVVTITGSGAQERDEAVIPGYRLFREVADTLARRGIATLRLDDRGTGASTGDFSAATSEDFADDVRAAVDWLRDRDDIDPSRIALVGHSEGGMIAPMVSAADSLPIPIVLLAGTALTGREIIEYQQRSFIEGNADIPETSRDSVLVAARGAVTEAAANQPWMRFFLDHDPLPVARRVTAPVLILHGVRILILGAGDVGFHLAQQLAQEGHDVVVVEQDRERARLIQDTMDALVVEGNGASLSTLERAGIARTDLLLAVTSQDEINLMACLSAAQYAVPTRIARVSKPDYYDHSGILPPERLGVDLMINPERECALETYQLLQSAAATEFAQFEGGLVQLIGVRVKEDAPVAGKRLIEIGRRAKNVRALVVAIARGGETIIPTGATRIEAGDQVFIMGEPHHLPEILPLAGYPRFNLRRVVIAGGSRECEFLARMLEDHSIGCTILERDRRRAQELAESLDRSLVLHGDATDLELLEMEAIGEADGFVAYTGSDETNLLSCLLAKNLGPARSSR